MVRNFRRCLAAAITLWGVSLRAQVVDTDNEYDLDDPVQMAAHAAAGERASRLWHNNHQLACALTVDRTTPYFPGEAVKIEIKITNPTSSPLEVPDPNDPSTQCFLGSYEESCGIHLAVRSTTIQPGQVIVLTVDGEDQGAYEMWHEGRAPTQPGKHHLRYLLGGSAEFDVGSPAVEASTVVALQEFKTYQWRGMKAPETVQEAAVVVAARIGDEHILLIGRNNMPTTYKIKPQKDGTLSDGDARVGAPWIRLATSPSAITNLKATADDKGRITIQYATSDGIPQTLYLDETRHPGR